MSELEDLKRRLVYIAELINEEFFELDEVEQCYKIINEHKDVQSTVQEVFCIAAMCDWTPQEVLK